METWIPWARRAQFEMKTQGKYPKGHPIGAVVHFTAGASRKDDGFNSMQWGRYMGYAFLLIERDGELVQANPLDRWGHHAGSSSWDGLDGGVSDDLVGIEIAGAGKLQRHDDGWYPYWAFEDGKLKYPGERIETNEIRFDPDGGAWHAYTDAQEKTLQRLLIWLARNSPVFRWQFILGHDEVAPRRKNDPGYALSVRMPELRKWIRDALEGAPSEKDQVTWFRFHRLEENGQAIVGIVAMAGAEPRATWTGIDWRAAMRWMSEYPKAGSMRVAPQSEGWPQI